MGDLSDAYEFLEDKLSGPTTLGSLADVNREAFVKAFLAGRDRMDVDPVALNMEYEIEMKLVPRRRRLNDEAIGALKKLHRENKLPAPFKVG